MLPAVSAPVASAPCSFRLRRENSCPLRSSTKSPNVALTELLRISTYTLSNSWSVWVVPSGWIGVFSSVRAAEMSISEPIFPASCIRKPELRERSLLDPIVNPRTILPLFWRLGPKMSSTLNEPRGLATLRESFPEPPGRVVRVRLLYVS